MQQITGNIVDLVAREVYPGTIAIDNGKITNIKRHGTETGSLVQKRLPSGECIPDNGLPFILPGFIDAHVHIESSILPPAAFGHAALQHGTVAVVSDPHEIANVCGTEGIRYMIRQAARTPLKIAYTVPSCVPATPFETSGATIDSEQVSTLLASGAFAGLSEMMNFPGVLQHDPECRLKIEATTRLGLPIDGHAPLLYGETLRKYAGAGISTDHESDSLQEAEEKIASGMYVQIREGSLCKMLDLLLPLLTAHPDRVMFCSDDLKAPDLQRGHINSMVRRAIAAKCKLFDVLQAATLNPVRHYNLHVGLLQQGDPADFILCGELTDFVPSQVWVDGERVDTLPCPATDSVINHFVCGPISPEAIADRHISGEPLRVIRPEEGSLLTGEEHCRAGESNRYQKIIVINRYTTNPKIAVAYVTGFNLREGAFGSTIAHDSHNIIVTGSSDALITRAANRLIAMQGGMVCCDPHTTTELPLPIAGLMSDRDLHSVVRQYGLVEEHIRTLGCPFTSPIMQLAFLALPVIPSLRLTDRGLFDVSQLKFV